MGNKKLKAQLSITGIITIIISMILIAYFMPIIDNTVSIAVGYSSVNVATIWRLIPLFLGIIVLAMILLYAEPLRQRFT